MIPKGNTTESFRDSISTVNKDGKRNWIFPTKPKGDYTKKRTILAIFYYALFFGLPFIFVNGNPLFLFNIPEGKFIIFGYLFWPEDFLIFGLIMLAGIVFIALFTNAFGRIFCGWICPQPVFLEFMFRKVDYWILGSAGKQRYLHNKKWDKEKRRKYALRYFIYFILSFIIANTFLSYIIGIDELYKIITGNFIDHYLGFIGILIFTIVFFSVFAFLREQVCTNICPYGRLQGVLLDENSIVVAYDYVRGEPRGKFTKKADSGLGDCIDCYQCVDVCPTGIDIRNGTQLECINCTACIDACDDIMIKVGRPTGLIRYDSENNIAHGKKFRITSKMYAYSAVLLILTSLIIAMLITRKDVGGQLLRTSGMVYQKRGDDSLSNMYNVKLTNKTNKEYNVSLRLIDKEGEIIMIDKQIINLKPESQNTASLFIVLPKSELTAANTKIKVEAIADEKVINTFKATFAGPIVRN
ncbi:MAG TPA: cytochrome c oxidase accessory protein CcoG [Chitinophagaceae bacterium]|nr:cytochrome c oxidase accessory protein CcoG [Chitinophagaceae bacterium]